MCAQVGSRFGHWWCCAAVAGLLIFAVSGCSESGIAREPQPPANQPVARTLTAAPVGAPANKVATRSSEVRSNGVRDSGESLSSSTVPAWAADAVFYQIFPERFCNGDHSNDPTRESLESPDLVPKS